MNEEDDWEIGMGRGGEEGKEMRIWEMDQRKGLEEEIEWEEESRIGRGKRNRRKNGWEDEEWENRRGDRLGRREREEEE